MALKILLVDDEIIVRLGIKSVIDWEAHGFHYMGDAADGKQALELIEQSPPDILLTDIIMPHMNGLELIQIVRNRYPWIRIIVLSSHDQYDYVRKAMKMGVDDYILKASIEPEQLLDLLQETSNKIVADRPTSEPLKNQGHSLAQIVRNRLEGCPPLELDQWGVPKEWLTAPHRLLLVRVHGGLHFHADDPSAMPTLVHLIELQMKKWTEGHALHYKEQEIILLIPSEGEMSSAPDALQALGRDLISAAKRFLEVSISIGISPEFAGLNAIKSAYVQAKVALEQYFFAGKERIFEFAERGATDHAAILFPKEDERQLKFEIERMDEDGMRQIVNRVLDRMEEAKLSIESNIRVCLELLHCFKAGFKMFGEEAFQQLEKEMPMYKRVIRFEELTEARLWFDQFIAAYSSRARAIWGRTCREEIQRLILYIKSNYADDLSLRKAAEMVNVSEGYLSHLFKKELQTSFTEYVNQIRVEKAAELLHETNWPHYKIAEKVGYENINYFGRVFKKIKGMSPKQYRAQFVKTSVSSVPVE